MIRRQSRKPDAHKGPTTIVVDGVTMVVKHGHSRRGRGSLDRSKPKPNREIGPTRRLTL